MRNRKQVFYIVLMLFALIVLGGILASKSKSGSLIFPVTILLVAGVWILLRKRIIGGGKSTETKIAQPFSALPGAMSSTQAGSDYVTHFSGPKIRRDKNFIVEDNLEAIRWPQECSWCGRPVEHLETLKLKEKFKTKGQIQAEVAGIPYCKRCAGTARWTGRINTAIMILALVIGIVLTIFSKIQEATGTSGTSTPWYLAFLVSFGIGYGLSWLLLKLPFKLIMRKRLTEPVTAWLMEGLKSDGQQGISVAISIPKKSYAEKFAQMNVTAATSSIPVNEIDDERVVRVIQPSTEQRFSEISSKTVGKIEGIDLLIECTRDDVMDTTELWEKAKDDLKAHGEDGSYALAALIEEMLKCRSDAIGTAITMSRHMVPTTELMIVLKNVISAHPLTSTFFGARFRPQIEGGGMIGWTDGTAARFKTASAEALAILERPLT